MNLPAIGNEADALMAALALIKQVGGEISDWTDDELSNKLATKLAIGAGQYAGMDPAAAKNLAMSLAKKFNQVGIYAFCLAKEAADLEIDVRKLYIEPVREAERRRVADASHGIKVNN